MRALEGACVVVADDGGMDAGRVRELIEDVDVETDKKGIEAGVMLLLVDEVAEDNIIEVDTAYLLKDSSEGA